MTNVRWLTATAAISTAVVLAGCSVESTGSPMPDDTVSTSGETDTTEPISERPREIKLDGKDPCGLIPHGDWSKFDIEAPGRPSEEPTFRSPNCHYGGAGSVTLVVTEGVEAWDDRTHNVEINDAESIKEFPTITIWNKVDQHSCYTVVDVADGQYLMTTAMSIEKNPEKSEVCDLSYQLAESAMKTLVTL